MRWRNPKTSAWVCLAAAGPPPPPSDQTGLMRDSLGVLLVAAGLSWTVLMRDKLGLVIAFAGVTLLAYNLLRPRFPGSNDGKEPPIF